MTELRQLPISNDQFAEIADKFGTPLYVYDEAGIRETAKAVNEAFSWSPGYRNFAAVKAQPSSSILKILEEEGMGFDCSSDAELLIMAAGKLGQNGIFFTSNNVPLSFYEAAVDLDAVVNFDTASLAPLILDYLEPELPEHVAFRLNPGDVKSSFPDNTIGNPVESTYGDRIERIIEAINGTVLERGIGNISLHTMLGSNVLEPGYFAETAEILRRSAEQIMDATGIELEMINIGGGLGIPYLPDQEPIDLMEVSAGIEHHLSSLGVTVVSEFGRYLTGPHGFLMTRTHYGIQEVYKPFLTEDFSVNMMARLASVAGSTNRVRVLGREGEPTQKMPLKGQLCAASDRKLAGSEIPISTEPGDLIVIEDCGAHASSNATNFNGIGRPGEVIVCKDGSYELITEPETPEDVLRRDTRIQKLTR